MRGRLSQKGDMRTYRGYSRFVIPCPTTHDELQYEQDEDHSREEFQITA